MYNNAFEANFLIEVRSIAVASSSMVND